MKIIKTAEEYEDAKRRAARLVAADPVAGSREGDELELLAFLLADYEKTHFQIQAAEPIEAIRFRMEQAGLTQQDLVPYIGSKSKVSEVLSGKRRLTLSMIRALTGGLGIPLRVLVQPEMPATESTAADTLFDWKRFPVREMAARGYFGALGTTRALRASADELIHSFLAPLEQRRLAVLKKQSRHIRSNRVLERHALLAWSAQVMRKALAEKPEGEYEDGIIDDAFMRHVAQLSWSERGPVLAREFLSRHGISLVIERHLPKTYLDGAALFISADHRVIGMTLRYHRLDNFWFCLMHELAHIRLHQNSDEFAFYDDLEASDQSSREVEADETSGEALVPLTAWKTSPASTLRSWDAAVNLARRLNVHPAVVVGRMRRESNDFSLLTSQLGNVRELFPEYHGVSGANE